MRIVDMRYLNWDMNPTNTIGTAGTFLKAVEGVGSARNYYKMSQGGVNIYGHESVNEVIVSRLLDVLQIEHLKYIGINALVNVQSREFVTYITKTKEFKHITESKMTLEMFYALNRQGNETIFDVCKRFDLEDTINKILLIDFLIINRDRHGANIEVLIDQTTKAVRIAPIFANGVAFVAPLQNRVDDVEYFDAMKDVMANNFVGTYSLMQNLKFISKPVLVHALCAEDRKKIFYGLTDLLPSVYFNKIWEIIVKRYKYAKDTQVLCER